MNNLVGFYGSLAGGGCLVAADIFFSPATLAPEMVALDKLEVFWPVCPGSGSGLAADLVATTLAAEVAAWGLRRPLLAYPIPAKESGVTEGCPRLWLLDGYRRLQALKSLGWTCAPTLVVPVEVAFGQAFGQALAQALAGNRERGFNPGELALLWRFITNLGQNLRFKLGPDFASAISLDFGENLASELAPFLGLPATQIKMRAWCLAAAELPDKGLKALAEGSLDLENGARLATWATADQNIILEFFDVLKPSKQKKRLWLDWLEDLFRRDQSSPAQTLAAPEILRALAEVDTRGRPAVEEVVRRYLWEHRHPLLADLMRVRQGRIKSLKLPPNARLEMDPTLEDTKFGLNLSFTNPAEFKALAQVVKRLAEDENFMKIIDDCAEDTDA